MGMEAADSIVPRLSQPGCEIMPPRRIDQGSPLIVGEPGIEKRARGYLALEISGL